MVLNKCFFKLSGVALAITGVMFLSSCATPSTNPEELKLYNEANDPMEPYNRAMTTFNFKVNQYVYRPFDEVYKFVFPEPVRTGISNASRNLSQPYFFVNAILQGELDEGAQIFGRFFTNTTLGIAGIFDVASMLEIEAPVKDFGQTLYRWGWNESMPYFVWPFLGPSDIRETTGTVIGFFLDPIDYVLPKSDADHLLLIRYGVQGVVTIDKLSKLLQDVEKNSIDPYIALRSMYRQNRLKFLNANDKDAQMENYDFNFEFEDE